MPEVELQFSGETSEGGEPTSRTGHWAQARDRKETSDGFGAQGKRVLAQLRQQLPFSCFWTVACRAISLTLPGPWFPKPV